MAGDRSFPGWFTSALRKRLLRLCEDSYLHGCLHGRSPRSRSVDFFLLSDELLAFVEEDADDAYVVFRGSHNEGNWFFTNFQAYRTTMPNVGGIVHQGFLRAFSWLWYGDDRVLDPETPARPHEPAGRGSRYLLGPSAGVMAVWLMLGLARSRWGAVALGAFAGSVVQVMMQNGALERLVRRPNPSFGDPLSSFEAVLLRKKRVFFIGHSLGGALAALAACAFHKVSQAHSSPSVYVVTFGAPRVGDAAFVAAFERIFTDRCVMVAHAGDPVAECPPVSVAHFLIRLGSERTKIAGLLVQSLFLPVLGVWALYSYLYRQGGSAEWSENTKCVVGPETPLHPKNHGLQHYRAALEL